LVAIARAHDLGEGGEDMDSYAKRLLKDIKLTSPGDEAGKSLIRLLERVAG
jgi:hypothetical protein